MALIGRRPPPAYSPVSLRALAGGWASALGSNKAAPERLGEVLRVRFAADVAMLTDSGTSALALAMTAALRRDAAIALPAYSCYDLATAAAAADVPVILYDIDPATLGPDWASLGRALDSRKVGAVVVAHLYGIPVDLTRAVAVCAAAGAVLIEDAAQGIGGAWNGTPLGSHGALTVLSFGRGKGVTGGGGGALLARGDGVALLRDAPPKLAPAAEPISSLTALAAQWLLARPSLYAIPSAMPFLQLGETVYREPHRPRAMPAALTGITLNALALADRETAVRRGRAETFATAAGASSAKPVQILPGAEPSFLRYPIVLGQGVVPDASGIGVMPGYPMTLADLAPFAGRCRNRNERFPGALVLAARLRTAPTHSRMSAGDVERVSAWLRSLS